MFCNLIFVLFCFYLVDFFTICQPEISYQIAFNFFFFLIQTIICWLIWTCFYNKKKLKKNPFFIFVKIHDQYIGHQNSGFPYDQVDHVDDHPDDDQDDKHVDQVLKGHHLLVLVELHDDVVW